MRKHNLNEDDAVDISNEETSNKDEIIDFTKETPVNEPESVPSFIKEPWHPEKAKMGLAYRIFGGIFSIFLIGVLASIFNPDLAHYILELWRTGLLPTATFILGYYFSKN